MQAPLILLSTLFLLAAVSSKSYLRLFLNPDILIPSQMIL